MLFGKRKFNLEIIEYLDGKLCQWGKESFLVNLTGTRGNIREVVYSHDNVVEIQLCLNDKPLYTVYSDNYYCPTCQKIIEEGYGIIDNNRLITEQVVKAQDAEVPLKASIDMMRPFFELMSDGLYVVTRTNFYPTDGEGNFFWNKTSGRRLYEATADLYYKFHVGSGYMSFLYPSQPYSNLNNECVQGYLNDEAEVYTGLAYYLEGAMALLLDGHHRATAACLRKKPVSCLTIARVNNYVWKDKKLQYFWAGGSGFNITDIKASKRLVKLLKNYKIEQTTINPNPKVFGISRKNEDKELNNKLDSMAQSYPKYREIAFESMLDIISFERLENLWNKYDEESLFEFELLLDVLYRQDKERIYTYLIEIVRDRTKVEFWEQVYTLLMTYSEEQVEEVVVEYLVNHDYDKRDPIRKIIDEYYARLP